MTAPRKRKLETTCDVVASALRKCEGMFMLMEHEAKQKGTLEQPRPLQNVWVCPTAERCGLWLKTEKR